MKKYNELPSNIKQIKKRQRQITDQLQSEKDEDTIIKLLKETQQLTIQRCQLHRRMEATCH